MKLKELTESRMSDMHLDKQDLLMQKFGFGDHDAQDVLDFVVGNMDWEDLGDAPREKLYSFYQKSMPYGASKEKTKDPYEFIMSALKTDLGLK